jgi:predicted phage-related endonuclease
MNQYIEVELTLDSFDLIQVENLIKIRIKELRDFKTNSDGWLHKQLADEQLTNYRATLRKITNARGEVARIKAEGDAIWAESRKAHASRTRKTAK